MVCLDSLAIKSIEISESLRDFNLTSNVLRLNDHVLVNVFAEKGI